MSRARWSAQRPFRDATSRLDATSGWASIVVGMTALRVIVAPWMRALPMKAGAL